ncbi:MAG TPA: hypothetical protein VFF73_02865 [Planctomycetota bacterium]|nr:hypothetical protein [Planctomycetota bacterium]
MLQEEQARPPSGRIALPEDLYKSMPVTSQQAAAASSNARATSSEDLLRTIMSSLPPDVAASLARAASGQQPQAPPPTPRPTAAISPELLRQLQELQRRLGRPGEH